jgi:hypothetical protein
MKEPTNFRIIVNLETTGQAESLRVSHMDETFNVQLNGKTVIILNNGDNSWSLVEGDLDQLNINLIGDAIEQFYKKRC